MKIFNEFLNKGIDLTGANLSYTTGVRLVRVDFSSAINISANL